MFLSVLSVVTFFATSVSSTSSPAPGAAQPQMSSTMVVSCGAVSRDQIEDAIGRLVAESTQEQSRFGSTCRYSAGDTEVEISIQHLTQSLNLPAELERLRTDIPGAELREVAGLAEHAYAVEIPDAGTQLHVLPGEREYFMVSVLGLDAGHHGFDAAMKIAQAVLKRR
jgi:hypothetical protein